MKVSQLFIHPIKSCKAVTLQTTTVELRGLSGDRRAMIVRPDGQFITQRSHSNMTQIFPIYDNGQFKITLGDHTLDVGMSENRQMVTVWKSSVDAVLADQHCHQALSDFLGEDVRLAVMDEQSARRTNPDWGKSDVSFADGYPVLVTNSASLKALSEIAGVPLTMKQFRPNIVIQTDEPWAEDQWRVLKIGDVILELVKPCQRCVMTTFNPETGDEAYPETMAALIKSRRSGDQRAKGVLFGWNAIVRQTGKIDLGMPAEVLERRQGWPIL